MTIGEKIKKIRKDMKISQSDMSKTLGINRNQLSRIENNHSEISAKNIETLCTKYNISINELLDLNNENTNKEKIDYIYNSWINSLLYRKYKFFSNNYKKISRIWC